MFASLAKFNILSMYVDLLKKDGYYGVQDIKLQNWQK